MILQNGHYQLNNMSYSRFTMSLFTICIDMYKQAYEITVGPHKTYKNKSMSTNVHYLYICAQNHVKYSKGAYYKHTFM